MSNILAIAHKELKGYFASPIAYILIGCYAVIFGFFFYAYLAIFNQQSLELAGFAGRSANVNEQLIRPVFLNVTVIALFILPMVTMRTYAEEKRSGTIELLLTAPLTDFQIIMGKFLGAMGLYVSMLVLTLLHVALLYTFGTPEWIPIATTYLGLLLLGCYFISFGLLISSFTKNQIVAGIVTFALVLMFWVINWIATFVGPTAQAVLNYLSIMDHLDDFSRGIIDTKHVVYYLTFSAFGLFLTARSVDSERWRG